MDGLLVLLIIYRLSALKLFPGGRFRKSHSKGKKSHAAVCGPLRRAPAVWWLAVTLSGAAPAALGADDPGTQALQQHQLQRQQQQDALQLRMQQQQRGVQDPPADARQQQALEQLQINQQQQQQQLHYRQGVEPVGVQPSEGDGTRQAKAQMELQKAQQQSQQQLRRFESELQVQPGGTMDESRKVD